MTGTQISDMTDSLTDFPDGAFVPFVVEESVGGLNPASNYRFNLGAALLTRVSYNALAAAGGAELVGTTDGNVQSDLDARPTSAILAATDGSSLVGFEQAGAGATPRTVQDELSDWVKPQQFGAVGDGVADDLAALNAARDEAISTGKGLLLTDGVYRVSDTWNAITGSNQHVVAKGDVTIYCTGSDTGVALGIMSGSIEAIYGCTFGGDVPIRVRGTSSCTDAVYARAVCHSTINVNVRDCTNAGLRVRWGVKNIIHVRCVPYAEGVGDGPFLVQPTYGLQLESGGEGLFSSANDIYPMISGVSSAGIVGAIDGAGLNNIWGGACETSGTGLVWSSGCRQNTVHGTDFETNSVADISDDGHCNSYFSLRSNSPSSANTIQINGSGANFHGCTIRLVNLSSGSRATSFSCCRFDKGPTVGIQGSGPYKRIGCSTFNNDFSFDAWMTDVVGDNGTYSPVITQGGAVSATTTASYSAVGDNVSIMGRCEITGAGSAAAIVVGGIPADLVPENLGSGTVLGTFWMLDAGTEAYSGVCYRESDSTFSLRPAVGSPYSFALASGDVIGFTLSYKRSL